MVVLAAAAILQKPVVLPERAMRLDALLKEVGAATGEAYKAAGPMAGRIVIVAGPPRPASALRTDLATATFGKWRRVGDEWLIDEDMDAVRERERRRLASRIAQVKAQQAKMREEVAKPFDATRANALLKALDVYDKAEKADPQKSYPYFEKAKGLTFADAAAKRIVASLDPQDLAALERGHMVWSDRPTRLQKPLPPALAANVTAQMTKDQKVWTSVFLDGSSWREGRRGFMSADPRAYDEPFVPGSLRLFVKAEAFEHGQTHFSVQFLDKAGAPRQFGDVSLEFRDRDERPDPSPAVDPKEAPIPLSAEATAYSDAQQGRPPAALLRPILLNPEKREPLDILFGEGLRGVARARGASVVAWLADDTARFGLGDWKGKRSEPSAGGWLRAMWLFGYEVQAGPAGTVLRPRVGGENVDRAAVGRLARTIDRLGYLPLDDAADYAAASQPKGQSVDPLAGVLFENAMPGLFQLTFRSDWRDVALWGGFPRPQRQALLTGGTVPWETVPRGQRDRLVQAVLRSDSHEFQPQGPNSVYSVLTTEPTEVLAGFSGMGDGVRGTGRVHDAVFVKSTDENPLNGGLASASALASAFAIREREPNETHYDGLPKVLPEGFVPGREIEFGFTISLSSSMAWTKYGQFGEVDLRAKPQPLGSLSPGFQQEYRRAVETARRGNPNGG